jgi:hypothetical protein
MHTVTLSYAEWLTLLVAAGEARRYRESKGWPLAAQAAQKAADALRAQLAGQP